MQKLSNGSTETPTIVHVELFSPAVHAVVNGMRAEPAKTKMPFIPHGGVLHWHRC